MDAGPLVTCRSCGCAWYGVAMAHGLEVLGHCPRCDGELEFRTSQPVVREIAVSAPDRPPAKALGLPKAPDR